MASSLGTALRAMSVLEQPQGAVREGWRIRRRGVGDRGGILARDVIKWFYLLLYVALCFFFFFLLLHGQINFLVLLN